MAGNQNSNKVKQVIVPETVVLPDGNIVDLWDPGHWNIGAFYFCCEDTKEELDAGIKDLKKMIKELDGSPIAFLQNTKIFLEELSETFSRENTVEEYLYFAFPGMAEKFAELLRERSGEANFYGDVYLYDFLLKKYWNQELNCGEWGEDGWIYDIEFRDEYLNPYFEKQIPDNITHLLKILRDDGLDALNNVISNQKRVGDGKLYNCIVEISYERSADDDEKQHEAEVKKKLYDTYKTLINKDYQKLIVGIFGKEHFKSDISLQEQIGVKKISLTEVNEPGNFDWVIKYKSLGGNGELFFSHFMDYFLSSGLLEPQIRVKWYEDNFSSLGGMFGDCETNKKLMNVKSKKTFIRPSNDEELNDFFDSIGEEIEECIEKAVELFHKQKEKTEPETSKSPKVKAPIEKGSDIPHWQKIRNAMESLGDGDVITYKELMNLVAEKFGDVKESTFRTYMISATVNHSTRVHYHPNKKPRTEHSDWDILYQVEKGQVSLYDPEKHGKWGIFKGKDGKMAVGEI